MKYILSPSYEVSFLKIFHFYEHIPSFLSVIFSCLEPETSIKTEIYLIISPFFSGRESVANNYSSKSDGQPKDSNRQKEREPATSPGKANKTQTLKPNNQISPLTKVSQP
mgnify:CR=1 FL=1